ncbi:MAG: Twitching motility protein PilT [Candidatus Ozemobacter sibiricus]|uniref:Twitching motility protein PilT n=1 Tax=Candidatus Ozemobacter sibiricus TaxID=2268124 RepID=A0A367ZTS7_9BACT|nr:MAG: Twitching motility protein PilT [Candidatus Ozemobacter sibiricus]
MKPKIFTFFDMALAMKASDLLLKPGAPPTFRQNRHLIISEEEPLAPQEMYDLFLPVLDSRQQSRLNSTFEAHGMYPYKRKARVRYYIFQQREGFAGSFRFIPTHVPTIQELQLPEVLIEVACRPRGLFLVTGPAGAGKSHTMAAMVNAINKRFARHIITMENPIEFLFQRQQSVFTQIEVGTMIPTYQDALANALREDPDVMLIGEMRDQKTVEMALVASETGHFVLSTLPTLGAAPTIERIVSFFSPEKQDEVRLQISVNLVGIFSQLLLPRIAPEQPPTVAYELLIANSGIRTMIRDKKYSQLQSAMLMARREGCVTLKDSLTRLLRDETANIELVKAMLQEIVE